MTFIPIIDRNYAARFVNMPVRVDMPSRLMFTLAGDRFSFFVFCVFLLCAVSLLDGRALRRLQRREKRVANPGQRTAASDLSGPGSCRENGAKGVGDVRQALALGDRRGV